MQAVTITHSPRGYKLKQPLTVAVPETRNVADQKLQEYIVNSLSWKMPRLVPFTFENSSTLELAKHLLRHRTASTATLYQYIYGVYLAPGSVSNHVKGVKALFRCNGLKLELPYSLPKRNVCSDRAPTPEELQHINRYSRHTRKSHSFNAGLRRIPHRHACQTQISSCQTRPRKNDCTK